jgi:hypothetical protein
VDDGESGGELPKIENRSKDQGLSDSSVASLARDPAAALGRRAMLPTTLERAHPGRKIRGILRLKAGRLQPASRSTTAAGDRLEANFHGPAPFARYKTEDDLRKPKIPAPLAAEGSTLSKYYVIMPYHI